MLKVSVLDGSHVDNRVSQKGKNYSLQQVWAYEVDADGKPKPFPTEVKIILPRDNRDSPMLYQTGSYMLNPSCITVDGYNNFTVGFPTLLPAKG